MPGHWTLRISNPDRIYFSEPGETELDLVMYYLAVGDGIVNSLRERPCMLHRYPTGVDGEKVHQKRLPKGAPDWIETVEIHFPRFDRTADELTVVEVADVVWAVQMSTVEFHPWNSRRSHVEQPDEWRIDIDPGDRCSFQRVQRVAHVVHEVLDELGATGWPKTSGGNGLHVYVRIKPEHGFNDVRRAALAFSREIERRAPDDATTVCFERTATRRRSLWISTRTRATTRSRPPTACVECRQPASPHRSAGTNSMTSTPPRSPLPRSRDAMPSSEICTPGSMRPCSISRHCSSGPTEKASYPTSERQASTVTHAATRLSGQIAPRGGGGGTRR